MLIDILINAAISFSFVMAAFLLLWVIGLKIKDISIVDLFWGAGFGLLAGLLLAISPVSTPYLTLLAALPILWACRYSAHLFARNFGHGEDFRYAALRKVIPEDKWAITVLKKVFIFQGLAMFVVAAPLWVALSTGWKSEITTLVWIGTGIWVIGFLFETIGDLQLNAFKARKKRGEVEKGAILDTGLWKFTRHPNYFGNAAMWWGIYLVACAAPYGWASIIGPAFMTLALVKLTGAGHLERTLSQRPAYQDYMKRTNMFIPWFPKSA